MKTIDIGGRKIGPGQPCFVLAEAGVNHNGDLGLARQLVDVAAQAGADAVKFQTFKADRVVSAATPKAQYQLQTTSPAESQLDMLQRLELSPEASKEICRYCRTRNVLFMSTPFDEESVDLLDELGVPAFKIASGEITNLLFLEYVARKGKPVILSTGMSYLSEVDEAVRAIRSVGCDQVALLHCISAYPTDPEDVNLRALQTLTAAFQVPTGFSDHTLGIEIPLAAVAMGACVIEKHFTLDQSLPGPDHRMSLPPAEFAGMVRAIRKVEVALGDGQKRPASSEADVRRTARRSLVAACDIPAGARIEKRMVTAKRPGTGLAPHLLEQVVGRIAKRRIVSQESLDWEILG